MCHLSHGCGVSPLVVEVPHLSLGCGFAPPFPEVWRLAPLSTRQASITGARVCTCTPRFVLLAAASWTSAHTVHTCDTICTLLSMVVLSVAVRAGGRVGCACEIRVLRAGSGSRPIPFACVVLVVPSVSHGPDSGFSSYDVPAAAPHGSTMVNDQASDPNTTAQANTTERRNVRNVEERSTANGGDISENDTQPLQARVPFALEENSPPYRPLMPQQHPDLPGRIPVPGATVERSHGP